MPKLGKNWSDSVARAAAARAQKETEDKRVAQIRETQAIIDEIPLYIEKAAQKEELSCHLPRMGYLKDSQMTHPGYLDVTAPMEGRIVHPEDFTDVTLQTVCAWCEEHGLECFLYHIIRPLDNDDFTIHIRPKP